MVESAALRVDEVFHICPIAVHHCAGATQFDKGLGAPIVKGNVQGVRSHISQILCRL
jgi:hypothetical protein